MSYKAHAFVAAIVGAASAMLYTVPASALTLSYEETSGGTTGQGIATSYQQLPASDTYARTFTAATNQIGTTGFGFYDDFVFTVAPSSVDAITSTINFNNVLSVNNLQVRLYNIANNAHLPVLGPPSGGAIDSWSQTLNIAPGTTGIVSVLPTTDLKSGTYVLEVRGNVTGTSGGSYSGTLNLNPVPLPAALPLLLSGLGLLGARRGRKFAAA